MINWLINFRPMQSNLWLHSRHVRRIDDQVWRHHQHPPQTRGWMVGGGMQQYHRHFSCHLCGDNLVIILWNIVRLNSSRIEILFRQLTKEGLFYQTPVICKEMYKEKSFVYLVPLLEVLSPLCLAGCISMKN